MFMLEIRPETPADLDAQFTNLVNSGRRVFIAEAVGEQSIGDLKLVTPYSPRKQSRSLVSDLSYVALVALVLGSAIVDSCHSELLDKNGEVKQSSPTIVVSEPTPEWAITAERIRLAFQTPTPAPRVPKGAGF